MIGFQRERDLVSDERRWVFDVDDFLLSLTYLGLGALVIVFVIWLTGRP